MNSKVKKIFSISFFVKLGLALIVPISLDESYYWLWGQNPQLSYFDHPPMVAWLMVIGDGFRFLGDGATRWPFVVLSHGTIWIWYQFVKNHLSEKQQVIFLWVALLNPLWGWGSIVATPDVPLVFFWSVSLFICQKLIANPSARNYALLGMTLGLGFLSKYIIVLFIPSLLLWAYAGNLFKYLKTPKLLFTIGFGLLFCLPVFLWNYWNEWASISFQWKHGMAATRWDWKWPLDYLAGQVGLIFPVFFVLFVKSRLKKETLMLYAFAAVPLAFFLFTSFYNRVEANWPIVAYPALYAFVLLTIGDRHSRWIKGTLVFWALTFSLVLSLPLWVDHFPEQKAKIKLFEGEKYAKVLEFAQANTQVMASSYQMASFLSINLNKMVCKMPNLGRRDFFNYLKDCQQFEDHFFYLVESNHIIDFEQALPDHEVVETQEIDDMFTAVEVQRK